MVIHVILKWDSSTGSKERSVKCNIGVSLFFRNHSSFSSHKAGVSGCCDIETLYQTYFEIRGHYCLFVFSESECLCQVVNFFFYLSAGYESHW